MSVIARAELLLQAKNYSGSGNWLDESGNGHDAVPNGSPVFNGNHWTLNGSSQYFIVADDPALDFADGEPLTIMVRATYDTPTGNDVMLSKGGEAATPGYSFKVESQKLTMFLSASGDLAESIQSAAIVDDVQHVFAGRLDGEDKTLAIDGSIVAGPSTGSVGDLTNALDLNIGRYSGGSLYFDGDLYAVALWREALTDAEIVQAGNELTIDQFVHGKTAGVLVNEFDFSTDTTQWSFGRSRQLVNVTTFGNDDKVFLPGIGEGQLNVQGIWNPAANASDEEIVALDGSEVTVSASPEGFNDIGDRAHIIKGELDNYQPRAPVNDAVRFSVSYTADDGARQAWVLHPHDQESTTGTFAAVSGLSGSNGAVAHLHVTQFSGTDATITLEDSTDNSTFATLQAFTQVTGTTSERIDITGNVDSYVRVNLTGTFTTITFTVTFATL